MCGRKTMHVLITGQACLSGSEGESTLNNPPQTVRNAKHDYASLD